MRRAFTLIELLIVVAIIGILAAIAVPNFLNAQIRAKIARVQADQKAYSVALESYNLDHGNFVGHGDYIFRITTPIAYIAGLFPDPFAPAIPGRFAFVHAFDPFYFITTYQVNGPGYDNLVADFNIWTGYQNSWASGQNDPWPHGKVRYQIRSIGPNKYNEYGMRFHSSNGLVSNGDVNFFGPGNINRAYGGCCQR